MPKILFGFVLIYLAGSSAICYGQIPLSESEFGYSAEQFRNHTELKRARTIEKRKNEADLFRLSKWSMISGETTRAKYFLRQIVQSETKLTPVILRYRALIEFMEGNYKEALDFLSDPTFTHPSYYREICDLRILLQMIQHSGQDISRGNHRDEFRKEFREEVKMCRLLNTAQSPTNHLWLDNLESLYLGDYARMTGRQKSQVRHLLEDKNLVWIWLKMGLISQNEELFLRHLELIPEDYFRDPIFRELIGMFYFRIGDEDRALAFLEEIESVNADNIRGNLAMRKKQYELAMGHFELALRNKKNSHNALERAIPIALKMREWEWGLSLIPKLSPFRFPEREILTLKTIFLMGIEEFEEADKVLFGLRNFFLQESPDLLDLIQAHLALSLNKTDEFILNSENSCHRQHGLSCWGAHQTLIWDDFPRLLKRKEELVPSINLNEKMANLKKEDRPRVEDPPYINQRLIEELDDNLDIPRIRLQLIDP